MTPCYPWGRTGVFFMTETEPPEEPLEKLRRLVALLPFNFEPLEAVTLEDLQTEKILSFQNGELHHARH